MNQQELKPVGARIKSLLQQTGLKQKYLAEKTGVSKSIISRLVIGKEAYCSEERVNKIIEFLEGRK